MYKLLVCSNLQFRDTVCLPNQVFAWRLSGTAEHPTFQVEYGQAIRLYHGACMLAVDDVSYTALTFMLSCQLQQPPCPPHGIIVDDHIQCTFMLTAYITLSLMYACLSQVFMNVGEVL